LEYIIKKNPEFFYKGVTNQFDSLLISEYQIPVLPIEQQNIICNYICISKHIIESNNNNIKYYNNMKKLILENIPTINLISLNEIVNLVEEYTGIKLISILRNSISVGEVNLYEGKLNNNSYYLSPKNNNFILEYIYYYLKFQESYIKEISTLTQQNNLIKSNLLNIKIPNISYDLQTDIVNECFEFENHINILKLNNDNINKKNIFDLNKKINSLW